MLHLKQSLFDLPVPYISNYLSDCLKRVSNCKEIFTEL